MVEKEDSVERRLRGNHVNAVITGMKTRDCTYSCSKLFEKQIYTLPFLLIALHPPYATLMKDRTLTPSKTTGFVPDTGRGGVWVSAVRRELNCRSAHACNGRISWGQKCSSHRSTRRGWQGVTI